MASEYVVKVTVGDTTIEVTGDRIGTVEIVRGLLDALPAKTRLALPAPQEATPPEEPTVPDDSSVDSAPTEVPRAVAVIDARSFFQKAQPSTNIEAAVVAAYYLSQVATGGEVSDTITKATLEEVLRKARWKLPPRPDQVLVDAHAAGYLDRATRGHYKINNTGHNFVVHTLEVDT